MSLLAGLIDQTLVIALDDSVRLSRIATELKELQISWRRFHAYDYRYINLPLMLELGFAKKTRSNGLDFVPGEIACLMSHIGCWMEVVARDTSTRDFFRSIHVESEFAGCVSQTLPRYDGPRKGVLNVDKRWCGRGDVIYQTYTTRGMPELPDLITVGERRLNELRTAEEVWTARLHVLLPCRAMGTKVNLREIMETHEPHRFSGLVYDTEPRTYDLTLGSTEAE